MAGKRQKRSDTTEPTLRHSYQCAEYQRSGKASCQGYWIPETQVLGVLLPVVMDLIERNVREPLAQVAQGRESSNHAEGEIKAKLAVVNRSIKNLIESVKVGALRFEQIKADNAGLEDQKRRLERRLEEIRNSVQTRNELQELVLIFDHDMDLVLADLMEDRLRFNSVVRSLFSSIVVEIDRPGSGWRKGKSKGELPMCNARITKFALDPSFKAFVREIGVALPEALRKVESHSENLSDFHGSPRIREWKGSNVVEFFMTLTLFLGA